MPSSREIIIAAVLVVVLVVAYWYWYTKYFSTKMPITGLSVASGGAVSVTYVYSGKKTPSTWAGKKVTIYTQSLGTIKTTVASATAGMLTTAPAAYTGTTPYAAAASDHVCIH